MKTNIVTLITQYGAYKEQLMQINATLVGQIFAIWIVLTTLGLIVMKIKGRHIPAYRIYASFLLGFMPIIHVFYLIHVVRRSND